MANFFVETAIKRASERTICGEEVQKCSGELRRDPRRESSVRRPKFFWQKVKLKRAERVERAADIFAAIFASNAIATNAIDDFGRLKLQQICFARAHGGQRRSIALPAAARCHNSA